MNSFLFQFKGSSSFFYWWYHHQLVPARKGVRPNLEAPRAVGTQSVQENVRAVLEPHRWTILRRMCPEGKATNQLHVVIKEALDECNADGEKKLAVCFLAILDMLDGRPFVLSVLIYFPYCPCSKLRGLCFRGSGAGVLRPTTMAALLDDAEAVKLLAEAGLGRNCPNALWKRHIV